MHGFYIGNRSASSSLEYLMAQTLVGMPCAVLQQCPDAFDSSLMVVDSGLGSFQEDFGFLIY